MQQVFTTRNATNNGCPSSANMTYSRSKAEAKAAELMVSYPGIVFEVVEMLPRAVVETQVFAGKGRAGNSYRAKVARTVWVEK